MQQVNTVLQRLSNKGLQINYEKSKWEQPEVEYLGFLITRDGIHPQPSKVQGVLDMKPPKTVMH